MSEATVVTASVPRLTSVKALRLAAAGWFVVAAIGQLAFLIFIAVFYGVSTLSGDLAAWNDKPLITGHVAGDGMGNLQFAAHVLLAAVATAGGVLQFVPWIRRRARVFHRWNGRVYVTLGMALALGGLWLVWVRGTYLTLTGAFSVSALAVLIMICGAMTMRRAMQRRFVDHRRWALRLFIVMSGVWFQRIGYMAWIMLNGAPVGIGDRMDGWFDLFWGFGCYLVPLAVAELYLWADARGGGTAKALTASLLVAATVLTAVGIAGAAAFMWFPYI